MVVMTFEASNYRKHLLAVDKSQVSSMSFHSVIIQRLRSNSQLGYLAGECESMMGRYQQDLPPRIAVRLWTGPHFYGNLKSVLMHDDEQGTHTFAPFMRALNYHLVLQSPPAMTSWRGSKMSAEDLRALHGMFQQAQSMGKSLITRAPSYYPTSLSKERAKGFSTGYSVKFSIPAGCPNCCYIDPWSEFQGEEEVLFPPWTAFRIVKVDPHESEGVVLEVEVVDNTTVPESVGVHKDVISMVGITKGHEYGMHLALFGPDGYCQDQQNKFFE